VCADLGQPLTAPEWADSVPGIPYQQPCAAPLQNGAVTAPGR
jgi:hypothetical protein